MQTLVREQSVSKVNTILISQPKPDVKSPYFSLAEKHKIQIDFRPFIHVEGITAKAFRKTRIKPLEYSAIVFTSRNAIRHFFRICEESRVKMPQETKYFCSSEAIALFLQKFILYRKRKVFYGKKGASLKGIKDILKKHRKNERFLLPCSPSRKNDLPDYLKENNFEFTEAPIFETVASDLSDLEDITYDMIVFFSPLGLKSLFHNFPDFKQNKTRIAAFGPSTCKSVEEHGLQVDVRVPAPETPSMTMAIERYLQQSNK